jgi:riboflavin synthase
MFTGIIEATGRLDEVKAVAGGVRIRIETDLADGLSPGASLAVNGVCLTVVLTDGPCVVADIGPETTRITTLGLLQRGQHVNLERPLRADGRLDGHFVQGHVDGVGVITNVRAEAESHWLTIDFPASLSAFLIRKGSIAVDGISLTVAGLGDGAFDVMVIPYTWDHTTLRHRRPQDKVNLECDVSGKYVVRALGAMGVHGNTDPPE